MSEVNTDPYDYNNYDLPSIAAEFKRVKEALDEQKAKTTELQKQYDYLRKVAVPRIVEDSGLESPVNIKGVCKISVRPEIYASINSEKKPEAYAWLEEHGHGDIIGPTVNSSTFKAFCKEAMKQGEELPPEFFRIEPYDMAVIVKS